MTSKLEPTPVLPEELFAGGDGVIPIVENALHHARVHQQSFDAMPAPLAPGVSRLAVDVKRVADHGD